MSDKPTTRSDMASYSGNGSSSSSNQAAEGQHSIIDLPFQTRFALAFLGLWISPEKKKKKDDTLPFVINESKNSYGTVGGTTTDEEKCSRAQGKVSDCGTSPLETYDENMNDQKDLTSISKRLQGWTFSGAVGIIYLSCSCLMMVYDIEAYFRAYWGVKENALHLITYTTFIVQIMVVPFWCLYTRIKYRVMVSQRPHQRVSTVSRDFIVHRITFVRNCQPDGTTLSWYTFMFFMSCPIMAGCLRVLYDYFFRICRSENLHFEISHWNSLLGFIVYGCFCYIVYIERRSFEIETHQIYLYALEQAPLHNANNVIGRICRFSKQYKVLRKQMRRWMAFTIVVSTWGIISHITWNYLVFSQPHIEPDVLRAAYFLNGLVTSQKITFILVPCFALGGLNMDHVWRRFKEDIIYSRDHQYQEYWNALVCCVKDINKTFSGDMNLSLISTGVVVYLGLNLAKSQDIGFWIGPTGIACNITEISGL